MASYAKWTSRGSRGRRGRRRRRPRRGEHRGPTGPNQPRAMASGRVSTWPGRRARSARSRQRRPPRRCGSTGDGTGPRRPSARARRAAPARGRRRRARTGESIMPWSATTSSRTSAAATRAAARPRRRPSPAAGATDGRDAVAVSGPVEVAVVEVGQAARSADATTARGDPLPHPVGADEVRAPVRRHGQAAAAELALVDDRDAAPLRRSPVNAVACGCHSFGSTFLSHLSALSSWSVPGTREVKPTSPCARAAGRCRMTSGWSPWSTGRPRSRAPGGEQRGEVRAACGVAPQQLGAEPVDEGTTYAGASGSTRPPGATSPDRARPRSQSRRPARRRPATARRSRLDEVGSRAVTRLGARQSDSANASSESTASVPSAVAEARIEKWSEASTPCSRGRPRSRGPGNPPARGRPAHAAQPMVTTASAGGAGPEVGFRPSGSPPPSVPSRARSPRSRSRCRARDQLSAACPSCGR